MQVNEMQVEETEKTGNCAKCRNQGNLIAVDAQDFSVMRWDYKEGGFIRDTSKAIARYVCRDCCRG